MSKVNNNFKYPCTRLIPVKGFGEYLEKEMGEPRRNIRLFAREFTELITDNKEIPINQIIMTNSGSSANLVAALAIAEKLKREGKPLTVVTSAFTFPTTMSSLLLAGFNVKFIDVDKYEFNLSLDQLESLGESPSLVVATHFLGFPCDMGRLQKYKEKTGCIILQDACETLVCNFNHRPVYTFGDFVTWSFYHPHHLSSYGGGAVYTEEKDDYTICDSITHWGRACKCHIDEELCIIPPGPAHQFTYENIGVNVEISELNACFGRWQLREWNNIENKRRSNYKYLYDLLKNKHSLKVWDFYNEEMDSPFVFPILSYEKDIYEIWEIMRQHGIEIRTLMGGVTPLQKVFQNFSKDLTDFPNAEEMANHAFFVGCHSTLSHPDMEFIGEKLKTL